MDIVAALAAPSTSAEEVPNDTPSLPRARLDAQARAEICGSHSSFSKYGDTSLLLSSSSEWHSRLWLAKCDYQRTGSGPPSARGLPHHLVRLATGIFGLEAGLAPCGPAPDRPLGVCLRGPRL
jgi:hypothetical protein